MTLDTKTCSARYALEYLLKATLIEFDHLIAGGTNQVMAMCGLRQCIAVAVIFQMDAPHHT
jgi:hypothetical protein